MLLSWFANPTENIPECPFLLNMLEFQMKGRPLWVRLAWPNKTSAFNFWINIGDFSIFSCPWIFQLSMFARWQFPLDLWLKALVTSSLLLAWYLLTTEHLSPCKCKSKINTIPAYTFGEVKIQEDYLKVFRVSYGYILFVLWSFQQIHCLWYIYRKVWVYTAKFALHMFYFYINCLCYIVWLKMILMNWKSIYV